MIEFLCCIVVFTLMSVAIALFIAYILPLFTSFHSTNSLPAPKMKSPKKEWEYIYIDTFKEVEKVVEPMNWKSLEYYFRLYIGNGEVQIKVRDGAMLIERMDK